MTADGDENVDKSRYHTLCVHCRREKCWWDRSTLRKQRTSAMAMNRVARQLASIEYLIISFLDVWTCIWTVKCAALFLCVNHRRLDLF